MMDEAKRRSTLGHARLTRPLATIVITTGERVSGWSVERSNRARPEPSGELQVIVPATPDPSACRRPATGGWGRRGQWVFTDELLPAMVPPVAVLSGLEVLGHRSYTRAGPLVTGRPDDVVLGAGRPGAMRRCGSGVDTLTGPARVQVPTCVPIGIRGGLRAASSSRRPG
jgi:hypothetical protein